MARRKTYTHVEKTNQIRAEHVTGMGDVVFKGFQCLSSECREFIFVRKDDSTEKRYAKVEHMYYQKNRIQKPIWVL